MAKPRSSKFHKKITADSEFLVSQKHCIIHCHDKMRLKTHLFLYLSLFFFTSISQCYLHTFDNNSQTRHSISSPKFLSFVTNLVCTNASSDLFFFFVFFFLFLGEMGIYLINCVVFMLILMFDWTLTRKRGKSIMREKEKSSDVLLSINIHWYSLLFFFHSSI